MARKKLDKVPQYVQDLENGAYAEVVEDNGNEMFAYYVNPVTGWANGSRGSFTFEKGEDWVQVLSPELNMKLYLKLKEVRETHGSMLEKSDKVLAEV